MSAFDFRGWWQARPRGHRFPGAEPPGSWRWPLVALLVLGLGVISGYAWLENAWMIMPCSLGGMVFGQGALALNLSWRGHLLNVTHTVLLGAIGALTSPLVDSLGVPRGVWMVFSLAFAVLTMPVLGWIWSVTLYASEVVRRRPPRPRVAAALARESDERVVLLESFEGADAGVSVRGGAPEERIVDRALVVDIEIGHYALLVDVENDADDVGYRESAEPRLRARRAIGLGPSLSPEPDRPARLAGVAVLATWHVLFFGGILALAMLTDAELPG